MLYGAESMSDEVDKFPRFMNGDVWSDSMAVFAPHLWLIYSGIVRLLRRAFLCPLIKFLLHVLDRNVLLMRSNNPRVTEWICDLARAISIKLILYGTNQ